MITPLKYHVFENIMEKVSICSLNENKKYHTHDKAKMLPDSKH